MAPMPLFWQFIWPGFTRDMQAVEMLRVRLLWYERRVYGKRKCRKNIYAAAAPADWQLLNI